VQYLFFESMRTSTFFKLTNIIRIIWEKCTLDFTWQQSEAEHVEPRA